MNAGSLRTKKKRRRADINIVPLVDVLVVLIFFFLVSMQFRNVTTLQLDLPEIETAGQAERSQQVEIAITAEGDLYFDGQQVSLEVLAQRIALLGRTAPRTPVLIMADQSSFLRYTTTVMDLCRKEGLETIRLQSK